MLYEINSLQKNNTNPCRKLRIIQRFYSRYVPGLQATISRTYYERTPYLNNGDKRTAVITYFLSQTFPTFIKLCLFYKLNYFYHILFFFSEYFLSVELFFHRQIRLSFFVNYVYNFLSRQITFSSMAFCYFCGFGKYYFIHFHQQYAKSSSS